MSNNRSNEDIINEERDFFLQQYNGDIKSEIGNRLSDVYSIKNFRNKMKEIKKLLEGARTKREVRQRLGLPPKEDPESNYESNNNPQNLEGGRRKRKTKKNRKTCKLKKKSRKSRRK